MRLSWHIISSRYLRLLIGGGFLLSVIVSGLYFLTGEEVFNAKAELVDLEAQEGDLFDNIQSQLRSIIARGGIEGALDVIGLSVQEKKLSFSSCHNLLHEVGHRAYGYYLRDFTQIAKHISGACQGGYEHGVEAEIALESTNPQEHLIRFCAAAKKNGFGDDDCFHGTGHGFMDKFGGDLDYALRQCDLFGENGAIQSCYTGVFSEYGNRILGVDGHTGRRLSVEATAIKLSEHPLEYCQTFTSQYRREACNSQLVKLQYSRDIIEALRRCMYEGYDKKTQETCVRVSSFFYSDGELSVKNEVTPPSIEFLPLNLRKEFFFGVRVGFTQAQRTSIEVDPAQFCEMFPVDDKILCHTVGKL